MPKLVFILGNVSVVVLVYAMLPRMGGRYCSQFSLFIELYQTPVAAVAWRNEALA